MSQPRDTVLAESITIDLIINDHEPSNLCAAFQRVVGARAGEVARIGAHGGGHDCPRMGEDGGGNDAPPAENDSPPAGKGSDGEDGGGNDAPPAENDSPPARKG